MGQMMQDLAFAIPGVDEAMGFAEIMKHVKSMEFSIIVFDTAPTGHTLRFLSFPSVLEKALAKFSALGRNLGPMINQFSSMMGGGGANQEDMFAKLESMRAVINEVNSQFTDPDKTTFVCVCIAEFLSLYETERLIQELTSYEIDTHNIVCNQLLHPKKGVFTCPPRPLPTPYPVCAVLKLTPTLPRLARRIKLRTLQRPKSNAEQVPRRNDGLVRRRLPHRQDAPSHRGSSWDRKDSQLFRTCSIPPPHPPRSPACKQSTNIDPRLIQKFLIEPYQPPEQ